MYSTAEFRKGLKIEIDGEPFVIVQAQHVKPGKGVAFVKTRIKSLDSGRVLEKTYRSGEKVKKPDFVQVSMQYLYQGDESYTFMNNQSYEQIVVPAENMGDAKDYLKENLNVEVLIFNGRPIGIEMPNFVELTVTYCEPGVKGDTATGATKTATLETGATVQVPLFINEGDVLRLDTRTGSYVERVNR